MSCNVKLDNGDTIYRFPKEEYILKNFLNNYELLNTKLMKEKGITKAIVDLATERFKGGASTGKNLKNSVIGLINDLLIGKNTITNEALKVKFDDLKLSGSFWDEVIIHTELALIDSTSITVLS